MTDKRTETNESFYNSIAPDYNRYLTESDAEARKAISEIFAQNVRTGTVMDFGGGTGLDLEWLTNKYETIFLEPSTGMRSEAKKKYEGQNNVTFIEDSADFTEWSESGLPVQQKMSGVLANFAVLNCIDDVALFFEKISLIVQHNGHLVVTVIDPRVTAVLKNYSITTAIRILTIGKTRILNRYNDVYHPTFIYSVGELTKAAFDYFKLKSCVPVKGSNFIVLIFERL